MRFNKIFAAILLFAFTTTVSAQKIKPKKSEKSIKRNVNSNAPSFFKDDLIIEKTTEEVINGKFVPLESVSYHYDENEHLDSVLFFNWEDEAWVNYQKSFYKYHQDGMRLEYYYQTFRKYKWFSQRKWEYEYDSNKNRIGQEQFRWTGEKWLINNQNKYEFDSNNLLTGIVWRTFNNDKWKDGYLDNYSYDIHGKLLERHTKTRLFSPSGEWLNLKKTKYSRDQKGKLLETEEIIWANQAWLPFKKILNQIDDQGNIVVEIMQTTSDSINYQNNTKEEYLFNKENLLINVISSEWLEDKWVYTLSREYAYDNRQNQEYMLAKEWSTATSEWIDNHQIFYKYQLPKPNSSNKLEQLNFSISPNPNNGKFNIELAETQSEKVKIKIYSLDGVFVGQYFIDAHTKLTSLNLNHLNSGTYILSITLKQAVGKQKIIIAK